MLLFLKTLTLALLLQSSDVYICDSKTAHKYHRTQSCKGLNRCTHTIKKVTLETAQKTRSACKVCY